jgi:hypothetical protein
MTLKDEDALGNIRRFLLATVVISLVGTEIELLILGHVLPLLQIIPVFLIALALGAIVWYGFSRNGKSMRVFQGTMVLCIISGLVGVVVHLAFSAANETKKDPTVTGMKLVRMSLNGKAPPLAPAVMVQIGLIGLAYTYRHPALDDALIESASSIS